MRYIESEFAEFWKLYPRKIGRLAAERGYKKARKQATAEAILTGLMLFNRNLPQEERFIPHAATWLNQGRWMDELPSVRPVTPQRDWYEECQELHGGTCMGRQRHHTQMTLDEARREREAS